MRLSGRLKTQHSLRIYGSAAYSANTRVGGRALSRLQISREHPVESTVRSAWRRSLLVLTFEQLAFTLAVILGGGILMLVLGTQILNWYWLTLFAVIGFA